MENNKIIDNAKAIPYICAICGKETYIKPG